MLIRLTVGNFRSFRDPQTLDLRAAERDTELPQNVIEGADGTRCVRSAVLYGANASGKSNLVLAVHAACRFMTQCVASPRESGEGLVPFRLDAAASQRPCRFEFEFHDGATPATYGFEATQQEVHSEWLSWSPRGRSYEVFRRERQPSGKHVITASRKHGDIARLIHQPRPQALVLTQAASVDHAVLGPLFKSLTEAVGSIFFAGPRGAVASDVLLHAASQALRGGQLGRDDLLRLLRDADLGIRDVEVSIEPGSPESFARQSGFQSSEARAILDQFGEVDFGDAVPVLRLNHGEGPLFDLGDESEGTRRLLAIGPLLLWMRTHGGALFVDELSANLHPELLAALLRLVQRPDALAQLIFTTHDATLLDAGVLRRDQVWFVQKGADGASQLRPLLDFKPRKGEALQRGYLAGRYGAVPFLEDLGA